MAGNIPQDKELPLAGAILCCTSIIPEQRAELAAIASQMGAVHKFDLTSDVTHLIVGETNTPKYKFVARQRSDVVVVKPEWVNAVRESWMEGGDTDIHGLEEKYRFPTFAGLSICVTGFPDQEFREHLKRTIIANGGEFSDDLVKSVTHLIANNTQGKKYQFALEWGVKVVSPKWFNECVERGMILEEDLFSPSKPDAEQGIGAWNRSLSGVTGKRSKPSEPALRRPRKLRRTASTKLIGQAEGLWTDIVGKNSESVDIPKPEEPEKSNAAQAPGDPGQVAQTRKSFPSETASVETRDPVTQDTTQDISQVGSNKPRKPGIFSGCRFFIHGFTAKQVPVLQSHLLSNGADISPSLDELSPLSNNEPIMDLYVAVPYNTPRSKLPSTDRLGFDPEIVTDMWIERCLYNKKMVPPEAHITSTPFPKFPIPAFHGLKICSTGFANVDLLHVSKLVNLIGATYDEYLTPKASVLICNSPNPSIEKLRHTYEWKIPTVIADWLWISVQTGEKKPFDRYLIQNEHSSKRASGSTARQQPVQNMHAEQNTNEASQQTQPLKHSSNGLHRADAPVLQPRDNSWGENSGSERNERPGGSNSSDKDPYNHDASAPPPIKAGPESVSIPEKAHSISTVKHIPSPAQSPSKAKDTESNTGSEAPQFPRKQSNGTAVSGPLEVAIGELLRQKRQNSRKPSDNSVGSDGRRAGKRRPLLGRANSLASGRAVTAIGPSGQSNEISRAGSIDSLNDDGTGSVIGSVIDESDNQSNYGKGTGQSFNSVLTTNSNMDNGFNVYQRQRTADAFGDDGTGLDGDESPHMTQLGYEDPDAVAMREKITGQSEKGSAGGKNATIKNQKKNSGLVLGEVKDLESLGDGWGGGRRTRRARGGGALEEKL